MSELGIFMHDLHEVIVEGKRTGRHVHHDSRSKNYPAPQAPSIVDVRHRSTGLPLNQGKAASCTANALCAALNCAPDYTGTPCTEDNAIQLYIRETTDEGKPYPRYDPGGSGLAVCQAAIEMGWLSAYGHTFDLGSALRALVLRPTIFGITWYSSFDTPDYNGNVTIASSAFVRGGHEVCACGIDVARQLVWFWNSWGPTYGEQGKFSIGWETLETLLAAEGDCTVPLPHNTVTPFVRVMPNDGP
jgi:hypothetical protein